MNNVVLDYDCAGWATKNDIMCSDGRIIRKDAFQHNDGEKVPLVWNHQHNDPNEVLGHALLENRDEGVYAYCKFNDTESGKTAKLLVQHGDISSFSIYANKLKQQGPNVIHGSIREVSLVLASANPGASIMSVLQHGEESDEEAVIYTGEEIELSHADDESKTEQKEEKEVAEEKKTPETKDEKTIQDVLDSMNEEQKDVTAYLVQKAIENAGKEDKEDNKEDVEDNKEEGDDEDMKHNVFDQNEIQEGTALSHADGAAIVELMKKSGVGSLKDAMSLYAEEMGTTGDALAHGFETEALTDLLPDYKNLTPGAPEILGPDQSWVMDVINKIHKSPYSRIRTRQADARIAELKAKGYQKKGDQKTLMENIKLLKRSFDPQTVYVRDQAHRDDIVDITEFDYVMYIWGLMKRAMYETLALAALVGDGRDDADPDKIHENHICPIYNDEELYTIHKTINFEAAKSELQGTNTGANFSENYIYAEAIIREMLYAREKYKGSGKPDFFCDPHLVNIMLLARDLNGRRIYDNKEQLAKALNVGAIYEIEQLADKTRTTKEGDKKKLLGLVVNLADYQFGSTKGGEVTKFDDFNINTNTYEYLMETRLSGALIKPYSAIALEVDLEEAAG